jgi:hypothetical protein
MSVIVVFGNADAVRQADSRHQSWAAESPALPPEPDRGRPGESEPVPPPIGPDPGLPGTWDPVPPSPLPGLPGTPGGDPLPPPGPPGLICDGFAAGSLEPSP